MVNDRTRWHMTVANTNFTVPCAVFGYDLTIDSDAPAQIETNVKIAGETLPYTGPEFY
jgi:hypothetical protein